MDHPFATALRALYEQAGMRLAPPDADKPAMFLTDSVIKQEVVLKNIEVLVVLAFAINPGKFAEHVEVSPHPARKDVFCYRVKATGNAYQLTAKHVFTIAVNLLLQSGRKAQVLA